jgi:Ca-activated chloride channel homolog
MTGSAARGLRRASIGAVGWALALSAPLVAQQVFRGGTDVVSLSVTVTDTTGRLVPGLDQDSFQVFEDGVLQDISTFSRAQQPIALSILLDTSTSMEKKLGAAQQAAAGFVATLGPHDVAQIIDFDSRAEVLQTFTSDKAALEGAIRRTQVGGSTSLYNALYIALTQLKEIRAKSADQLRRQAIIVLSDGEDTSSVMDYEQVLDQSKRSEVSVYAIGLRSRKDQPTHGWNEAEFVLRTLSQETGGRVFFVEDIGQLKTVYQQIADELANQYTIGYISKNHTHDGAWRRIVVRVVNNTGATARTKSGYFGPAVVR